MITLQNSIVVDLELFYIVLVRLLYSKWFYPLPIRLRLKSNLELLYLLLIGINLFFSLTSSCLQIGSQSFAPRVKSFIKNVETCIWAKTLEIMLSPRTGIGSSLSEKIICIYNMYHVCTYMHMYMNFPTFDDIICGYQIELFEATKYNYLRPPPNRITSIFARALFAASFSLFRCLW